MISSRFEIKIQIVGIQFCLLFYKSPFEGNFVVKCYFGVQFLEVKLFGTVVEKSDKHSRKNPMFNSNFVHYHCR